MRTPRAPEVTVEVTDDMIRQATVRDSSHCMIAEAVKAAYPDAKYPSVDVATIRFSDPKKGLRFTYLTPRRAQVAIVKWDQGIFPEPFTLKLRGGQVTRAGSKTPSSPSLSGRVLSPAEREQRRVAGERGQAAKKAIGKARLVDRRKDGHVADRVGGKTPPVLMSKDAPDVPFSRRRAFGLRGLEL